MTICLIEAQMMTYSCETERTILTHGNDPLCWAKWSGEPGAQIWAMTAEQQHL